MSAYLKLEPGIPYQIALKYPTPKEVKGFQGPQHMWTLMNGQRIYTDFDVQAKITALGIKPGQRFTIERAKSGKHLEWRVSLPKQPAIELLDHAEGLDSPVLPEPVRATPTQLEHALKTAVDAAAAAEKFGASIGYAVRFRPEDIRAMGISVLIAMDRSRHAA